MEAQIKRHSTMREKPSISVIPIIRERKATSRRPPNPRAHETEEEAIIRRFHDAQRMARFRARRKKALEEMCKNKNDDISSLIANIPNSITVSIAKPPSAGTSNTSNKPNINSSSSNNQTNNHQHPSTSLISINGSSNNSPSSNNSNSSNSSSNNKIQINSNYNPDPTKYTQLLAIIERIGKDIKLSYAGSRSSAERLKSGIVKAKNLVRDCLIETRINLMQQ